MYEIVWRPKARRQLKKIGNQHDRETIYNGVGELKDWPEVHNVKALMHHKYQYRLRIGKFRVFFNVQDVVRVIDIQEVKKRDERTY